MGFATEKTRVKPVFFDMVHSNNAARVRLWMRLKDGGRMNELIDTKMVRNQFVRNFQFYIASNAQLHQK